MFQNSPNLFILIFKCAKFQEKKNLKKNDLWSSGNLKKKFPIFKLESDFFPHFLSKIRKDENSAHLFIVNFKCAKFKRN